MRAILIEAIAAKIKTAYLDGTGAALLAASAVRRDNAVRRNQPKRRRISRVSRSCRDILALPVRLRKAHNTPFLMIGLINFLTPVINKPAPPLS